VITDLAVDRLRTHSKSRSGLPIAHRTALAGVQADRLAGSRFECAGSKRSHNGDAAYRHGGRMIANDSTLKLARWTIGRCMLPLSTCGTMYFVRR